MNAPLSRSALLMAIRAELASRKSEEEKVEERKRLLSSHEEFTAHFFEQQQGQRFEFGPHHEVICRTLDDVFSGKIKRLIINVPPGYSKTELAVKMLIGRGFAVNPRSRFIHATYSQQLSLDNSLSIRDMIYLPSYQSHFAVELKADAKNKGLWKTSAGGHLRAASSGESITGFRAGILAEASFTGALVIDDALKPDDASYDDRRKFINNRWHTTFKSRLAHEDVPVIVVMQRLHSDDFSGYLLRGGSGEIWDHLILPVEIKADAKYPADYTHGRPIEHGLPAGPLWKLKHTEKQIDILRRDGKTFSSQYVQDPRSSENPAFPTEHFYPYEVRPRTLNIGIIVDPSEGANKKSDRTAMAVIGIDSNANKYLLDGYCHRMSLSQRWENLRTLWQRWSRMPGVRSVDVGYEKYGMQSDLSYIRERQEVDGPHFPIAEINWPKSGSHAKEDRIQRLEPDFKSARFFLPGVIWRQEEGGDCYWTGEEHGITYRRVMGKATSQKRVEESGEGWRIAQPIKRRDENGQIYDVTAVLMDELKDFPNAVHDDMSDAVSRIYDLATVPASMAEHNEVAALNEMLTEE